MYYCLIHFRGGIYEYSSRNFIKEQQEFLTKNISNMVFKSPSVSKSKTMIKYANNLYKLTVLAQLNDEQTYKIFNNWKIKSNYKFNVSEYLQVISKQNFKNLDKNEFNSALRTLGYYYKKYNNIKSKEFYKELNFKSLFSKALNTLMYENDKVDSEINQMKERELYGMYK